MFANKVRESSGTANRLIFGYQWNRADVEASWEESEHDGTWTSVDFPSKYRSLSFDSRFTWKKKIRPFLVGGLGFDSLEVENGSTNGYRLEDAKFSGLSVRLGGGFEFPLHRRIGLLMQAVHRLGSFISVSGIASGALEDHVDANGMSYTVDTRFVFGKK